MKVYYYHALEAAAKSWEVVKSIPDYQYLVGELLFREIFNQAPSALSLYHFGDGMDDDSCYKKNNNEVPEAIYSLPAFKIHAKCVVKTLEGALQLLLGNDMSELALILQRLGARHLEYGVVPPHYRIVETALLRTLELGLKEHWNETLRKGWQAVFKFLAEAMMCGCEHELEIVKEEKCIKERRIKLQTAPRSEEIIEQERFLAFAMDGFSSPRWSSPRNVEPPLLLSSRFVVTPEIFCRTEYKRRRSFDVSPKLPVRSSLTEALENQEKTKNQDDIAESTLTRRNSNSIIQRPQRNFSPDRSDSAPNQSTSAKQGAVSKEK